MPNIIPTLLLFSSLDVVVDELFVFEPDDPYTATEYWPTCIPAIEPLFNKSLKALYWLWASFDPATPPGAAFPDNNTEP